MLSVKILPLFFNAFAFHNYMGICPARDPPPVPSECFPKPQSQYMLMPCAITLTYAPWQLGQAGWMDIKIVIIRVKKKKKKKQNKELVLSSQ